MFPRAAGKCGWVGVLTSVQRQARLVSSRAKASSTRAREGDSTLRDRPMIYCGELMTPMLIMCIDIPDDAIIYGAGF